MYPCEIDVESGYDGFLGVVCCEADEAVVFDDEALDG
jgi:hypothetical protein